MFGKIVGKLAKGAAPAAIRAAAEKAYAVERKATDAGTVLEPAKAKKAIREAVGRPVEGIVDPVYFELRGRENPLPLRAKTEKAISAAVRKRRDAGGPLGRWESVAVLPFGRKNRLPATFQRLCGSCSAGGPPATISVCPASPSATCSWRRP